jgi:hypothetical protein
VLAAIVLIVTATEMAKTKQIAVQSWRPCHKMIRNAPGGGQTSHHTMPDHHLESFREAIEQQRNWRGTQQSTGKGERHNNKL